MDATIAALLGAVIGGLLSVLASWLAQRVQSRAQSLSQEILRRQQLYSDFVEAAARCFGNALMESEPNTGLLASFTATSVGSGFSPLKWLSWKQTGSHT
jgi:hypothetical protein